MAISFWRAVPRASIMLARFRHATNRTKIDSPNANPANGARPSIALGGLLLKLNRDGAAQISVRGFGLAGSGMRKCSFNVERAAFAVTIDNPGLRRPITIKLRSARSVRIREDIWPGFGVKVGARPIGRKIAGDNNCAPLNSGGITPITVTWP